jgi:hypothetical protein
MKKFMVDWNEARIMEIKSNCRYRKYKESAHGSFLSAMKLETQARSI